jgi:hypothetical protein
MTNCSECERLRGESSAAFAEYTVLKDELAMTPKQDKSLCAEASSIRAGARPIT